MICVAYILANILVLVTFSMHIYHRILEFCSLVYCRHNSLSVFYKELLLIFHSLRVERDHRAVNALQKNPVSTYASGSMEVQYMEMLTPFAFCLIRRQIEAHSKVKIIRSSEQACEVECNGSSAVASLQSCSCLFQTST